MNMHELEQEVRQEVREIDLREPYPEDRCHEIADSSVPVYTATLMELAAGDVNLAHAEPECGPAFDGEATPVNIIAANVYERLSNAANDELREYQEDMEDALEFEDGDRVESDTGARGDVLGIETAGVRVHWDDPGRNMPYTFSERGRPYALEHPGDLEVV